MYGQHFYNHNFNQILLFSLSWRFWKWKWKSLSCVWYLTLCNPMDCSLPGSSVHEILQARILEWVAIPFSRESSQSRKWTQVSYIAGRLFPIWTIREDCGMNINLKTFHIHTLCFMISSHSIFFKKNQWYKIKNIRWVQD